MVSLILVKLEMKTEHHTDTKEIHRILRMYFKNRYRNKFENLKDMDKFFDIYILPKLNHDHVYNINRLIASSETESIIKRFPPPLNRRHSWITECWYKICAQLFKELMSPLLKIFCKILTENYCLIFFFVRPNIT